MKIIYTEEVKNKKNNPFLKMRDVDRNRLREHILKIVFYIAETHTRDLEVYTSFTDPKNADPVFGKSSTKGKPNTALAALTGAAEKLGRGDLSKNQLNNIQSILDWAATAIPGMDRVEFENLETRLEEKTGFEKLFEISR